MRSADPFPPLESHAERAFLLGEAHARPFHPARTPATFVHYGFITEGQDAVDDRQALAALCDELGVEGPGVEAKHHRVAFDGIALRWEQHTEFTTYTWESSGAERDIAAAWMRRLPQPGPLLVAVRLSLVEPPVAASRDGEAAIFLARSIVDGGAAVAATDFRPDDAGFITIIVEDHGLTPASAGALAQRLLELETYRVLALLALPEAMRLAPGMRQVEEELSAITLEMTADQGFGANHDLLQRLTSLAARLEASAASSLYRFAASRAYADIVQGRLDVIQEQVCPGYSTFAGFLSRRLTPAMRTCRTMEDRQANLSRKIARAAQLLRTRVDIELEHQNRDLLSSMNTRTRLQLRLQQTVEVLSIAAASYYLVGLLEHVFEGLAHAGVPVDVALATAVSAPVAVIGAAAFFVVRLHRGHADA